MSETHNLKIDPDYFEAVSAGVKTFEIRKNDRNYKVGDYVDLREFDRQQQCYTGASVLKQIGYITDYKQREGYVVFSLREIYLSGHN